MITVIGLWEDVWMDSERTERRLWKQTIHAYQVDEWIMVPDCGTTFSSPVQYDAMEEALEATIGKKTFFICPDTATDAGLNWTPLDTYQHPENPIYVIGNAVDNLVSYVGENDDIVCLNTPNPAALFSSCFLPIVLQDRIMKTQ